jgi:hypothetical protein
LSQISISLSVGGGGGAAAPPENPVEGHSVWLDLSDSTKVYQDAGLTTLASADNDPVRGVADKSGNARVWVMPGGYDPLLWRPALKGCDVFRHDAVFPRLQSSGWNVGDVISGDAQHATMYFVGQLPDYPTTDGYVALASEGYTSLGYFPAGPAAVATIYNGTSSDNATLAATPDAAWHILMLRLNGGDLYVGLDNLSNAALGHTTTPGMDAASKTQPLTTAYGVPPFLARLGSLLVYPVTHSEDASMAVAAWARGRWGF